MAKKADVITIITCDKPGCYLLKIAGSPDTPPRRDTPHHPEPRANSVVLRNMTTPFETEVTVAVNFPDVLTNTALVESALRMYDSIRQRKYPGEWFSIENWELDTRWFR